MLNVKQYVLVNDDKVERAINGSPKGDGTTTGGVTRPDGSYDDDELLAEYDRLGGLIRRGGDKVSTGSFYDFKKKAAREIPTVSFVYRVRGKVVNVPDGTELPGEVRAQRLLDAAEAEEVSEEPPKKKTKKTKKTKKQE